MAKLPTTKTEPDYLLALKKELGLETEEDFLNIWEDLFTNQDPNLLEEKRQNLLFLWNFLNSKKQQPVEEKIERVTPVWFQDTLQVQDLTDSQIVDCILETSIAFVPIADQQGELAFVAGIEND